MRLLLVHDPRRVDAARAVAHARAVGIPEVAHGVPPWLEHTGQLPPRLLDGDGYAVVAECATHPREVLAVVPHGAVRGDELRAALADCPPDPAPAPLVRIEVPLPFAQALRDLVARWDAATRGGTLVPASAGTLLRFR